MENWMIYLLIALVVMFFLCSFGSEGYNNTCNCPCSHKCPYAKNCPYCQNCPYRKAPRRKCGSCRYIN